MPEQSEGDSEVLPEATSLKIKVTGAAHLTRDLLCEKSHTPLLMTACLVAVCCPLPEIMLKLVDTEAKRTIITTTAFAFFS